MFNTVSRTDRLGVEVDRGDGGQGQQPDAGRDRDRQPRGTVGRRRDGVADGSVAVGTQDRDGEDRREPVQTRRRVEQLADRLAEYPLLGTRRLH